jgi:hypothetical protein
LSDDEGAEQLERVLRSTVNSGHVGALSLDPKYFVFEAAPRKCFKIDRLVRKRVFNVSS